jgi:hypothetical protein
MKKINRLYTLLVLLLVLGLACSNSAGDQNSPVREETDFPETEANLDQPEQPDEDNGPPEVLVPVSNDFPLEAIWIVAPGPLSQITSPVMIEGFAKPTFEQTLVVEIADESGIAIAIQPAMIQAELGLEGPFNLSLVFSVSGDQLGRLSVYDLSPKDGGLVHLASVPVYLNASGVPVIESASSPDETIAIFAPLVTAAFSGGVVDFSGYSEYFFESNLGVMLCGEGGSGLPHKICGTDDNVLAEGFATIDSPDMGLSGPFSGSITYLVSGETRARLVIFAVSPRDGGIEHLSSVEVILNP